MNGVVDIRGVRIGEGRTKICVPITASTQEDIHREAVELAEIQPDLVEWRIDCFDQIDSLRMIFVALEDMRNTLGEIPIICSLRSVREGGARDFSPVTFMAYNKFIANNTYNLADAMEVQLYRPDIDYIIEAAHIKGKKVILSNHDMRKTPPRKLLLNRIRCMKKRMPICSNWP